MRADTGCLLFYAHKSLTQSYLHFEQMLLHIAFKGLLKLVVYQYTSRGVL